MDYSKQALEQHKKWKGKIEVTLKAPIDSKEDLSVAYTPGVAAPCLEISENEDLSYDYTLKSNLVAVITDGTAVLGLGDIGPSAAMPVMEGKCALFKRFAGIDAIPLCIDSKDPKVIIETVKNISKSFGGINLEDISAPRCFEIEQTLIEECDIPVFHDDQHGTAIVTAAALLNAVRYTKKPMGELNIVISGAGAAGISIAKLLLQMKFGNIILCSSKGTVYDGAPYINEEQQRMAEITNSRQIKGSLADALVGADVLIGVSKPGIVSTQMVSKMAKDSIIFALANPTPEIMPEDAKASGAAVVGTGRSDFPNQINNILAFPGIFKGALACRARKITNGMKEAAARAIALSITDEELSADYVLPDPFHPGVVDNVANAVIEEAKKNGLNRI
ncbi:NAD(P)-dependent malic enzyme [Filifactor villosus]|uniref:NADP-dependent malic enzyme n=1 Tax=Filifactor villosus TaxID=29374 RepID=A0ABV9QKB0_9FIRM